MRKMLMGLIIACVCFIAGCTRIDHGTVIEKKFTASHDTYQAMPIIINKHVQYIPRWIHYSDEWSILVENDDGQEWWSVTEDYYNATEIGDVVDRNG